MQQPGQMLPRGETMSSISCSERPADAAPPDSNVCSRMDSVPHICPLPRLVRASDEGICNRHATPDEISRKKGIPRRTAVTARPWRPPSAWLSID